MSLEWTTISVTWNSPFKLVPIQVNFDEIPDVWSWAGAGNRSLIGRTKKSGQVAGNQIRHLLQGWARALSRPQTVAQDCLDGPAEFGNDLKTSGRNNFMGIVWREGHSWKTCFPLSIIVHQVKRSSRAQLAFCGSQILVSFANNVWQNLGLSNRSRFEGGCAHL